MDYKRDIIFTTTNIVEGAKIKSYLGVVTSNPVMGLDVFSEFFASFTDFFGGSSRTYQKHLDQLLSWAYEDLTKKVKALGGNAVLGLKIDFDEISGKNKGMFMVSVSGTAVLLDLSLFNRVEEDDVNTDSVTKDQLDIAMFVENFKQKEVVASLDEWTYIINNRILQLEPELTARYISYAKERALYPDGLESDLQYDRYSKYLRLMDEERQEEICYAHVQDTGKEYMNIIKEHKLFSPSKVLSLIEEKSTRKLGLELLKTDRETYSISDVEGMEQVLNFIDSLPDLGKVEEIKGGLLSSGGLKFICQCGEKNSIDDKFCSRCGKNIKGLSECQVESVEHFRKKISSLKTLLIGHK